ncbi:MAG: aspartate/glutamate racemase family protein, partial [Cyanobacteria bacterium P01_F01_bin.33]
RHIVHRIIYDELCVGVVKSESRQEYVRIIKQMQEAGAEGAIAGCTEITMLIQQQHLPLPLFDTAAIHARAAVELALNVRPT